MTSFRPTTAKVARARTAFDDAGRYLLFAGGPPAVGKVDDNYRRGLRLVSRKLTGGGGRRYGKTSRNDCRAGWVGTGAVRQEAELTGIK